MKIKSILILSLLLAGSVASQADTAENWKKHCAKCHGPDGRGDTKMGKKAGVKDMTTAEYQTELKDDKAVTSIKQGIKEGKQEKMKPNPALSDAEVKDLIAHIRQFKK